MHGTQFKVWISKYALTKGVYEELVETTSRSNAVIAVAGYCSYFWNSAKASVWHMTRDEALAAAENMRKRKIVSLQKQLKKLENLKF